MSFWIWVIQAEDLDKSNREVDAQLHADFADESARTAAYDDWLERSEKSNLYSAPLGALGTVCRFWSAIAGKLELSMLASLCPDGLVLETADQLEELQGELDVLEAYWDSHELRAAPTSGIYGHEREHLRERMNYLREAIRIAKENGATLGIT
jgi:hypothetical protein